MTERIPIFDDSLEIVALVDFVDNLTSHNAPAYVNEGCLLGLRRLTEGRYTGRLVLMFYNEIHPSCSHAMFIDEYDAFKICLAHGRTGLAGDLDIKYELEPEQVDDVIIVDGT